MAKIFGQLERAQLENRASDSAAAVAGLVWWNTTEGRAKLDDGTLVRALLRNDQKLVLGNSGTAGDNLRLNRGAAGVLQVLPGSDTTAEGTLATTLAALDAKLPTFAYASRPATGNAGRMIWVSDRTTVMVDTGSAWAAVGSGGAAGSLMWIEDANTALPALESNIRVYQFQSGAGQSLYALIKVPAGYIVGSPVKLKLNWVSPDSSGTALVRSEATLIRPGTDGLVGAGSAQVSTNSAATLGAGTANVLQAVELDLSSAAGAISSTAISPGDLIKVRVYRGTDTATSDLKVLIFGAEVTLA